MIIQKPEEEDVTEFEMSETEYRELWDGLNQLRVDGMYTCSDLTTTSIKYQALD